MTIARHKKRDIVAIAAASGAEIRVNRTSVINGRSAGRRLEWLREIFIMDFLVGFFNARCCYNHVARDLLTLRRN